MFTFATGVAPLTLLLLIGFSHNILSKSLRTREYVLSSSSSFSNSIAVSSTSSFIPRLSNEPSMIFSPVILNSLILPLPPPLIPPVIKFTKLV